MLDRLLLWLGDFRAERRNGLFSCSCYGGFDTYIKRFPKERSTIIFLTNHDFKNMSAIGNQLTGILQDQPYKRPKLSTAELLYKTYRMSGIAAVRLYSSLKQKADPTYDFSESELNELGYELLGKSKTADSIEFLKLTSRPVRHLQTSTTALARRI